MSEEATTIALGVAAALCAIVVATLVWNALRTGTAKKTSHIGGKKVRSEKEIFLELEGLYQSPRRCGGKLRVIASIEDPAIIERILNHLGRDGESVNPAHPGQAKRRRRPSRAPPQGDLLI